MHFLVKMLVAADNAQEALEQAETDCSNMVERGIIDWYDFTGRWGDSKAYGVNSLKGKKLLKEGMDNNRAEFDRGLAAIRYMMENYTDDEIYNESFTKEKRGESEHYLSRYQFSVVNGVPVCPRVYAMSGDLWGDRVEHDRDLETILKDGVAGNLILKHKKLWVVPVDVHN